jgi:hypothetical protein
MCNEFLLVVMKPERDGRTMLGKNTGGGVVILPPIQSSVLESGLRLTLVNEYLTICILSSLSACFTDLHKAFDRVNWTKLTQILKRTAIDWLERTLISKLYMEKSVKVRLDQGGDEKCADWKRS